MEVEYLRTAARLGLSLPAPPAGPEDGAVRPSVLPQKWRDSFLEKLRSMSEEDLRAFEEPVAADEKRRRKATMFLVDVALSDFVEAQNRLGRAVSTRTIIERRGFLLDGDVAQIHGRLKRLPKAALRWAWRWQRRHGLTRGKFRFGNGLTPQQQMDKACSENVAQNDFLGIQCSFFRANSGGCEVRISDPPRGHSFFYLQWKIVWIFDRPTGSKLVPVMEPWEPGCSRVSVMCFPNLRRRRIEFCDVCSAWS